jgi:hypothetical protein
VLSLNQDDRDRLVILHQVSQEQLSHGEGARRAGLGARQFRRLLRRFEVDGDAAVVHGLRGRPSNRGRIPQLREDALRKAREPAYRDFGPTLLSEHFQRETGIAVAAATMRRWMIAAGVWRPARQGRRHRSRRERRAAFGELVLMDTSIHPWLEARSSETIVLIALMDDATSNVRLRFYPRDTGAANREMLVDYLREHGRIRALYTDQASHFKVNWGAGARRSRDQPDAQTLIQRALKALGIELILALSPQAKGRVERLFKTLQDRLVKELRIAGISTMAEANEYLEAQFIPFWNQRFTVAPREAVHALRPLADSVDLLQLFAATEERVVRSDFTFRFKNQHFQITKDEARPRMPGTHVVIEFRLDGTRRYRWHQEYLDPVALKSERSRHPLLSKPQPEAKSPPPITKPAADHPWRQYRNRFPLPGLQPGAASPQPHAVGGHFY